MALRYRQVNQDEAAWFPSKNEIPEHINARVRAKHKIEKESLNWLIFFKTSVMQFKP